MHLPNATASYSYLVNPTVTLDENIVEGEQLYASQGQSINPLTVMSLTKQYAVIDPNDENQISIARWWKQRFPMLKVLVTYFSSPAETQLLSDEFGKIDQVDPLLSRRFGLEAVPSLVFQEDLSLKIEVIKYDLDLVKYLESVQ